METQEIRQYAQQLKTREDLLALINVLRLDELKEKYKPYTMKQLGYFCNPNHTFHRYRHFEIPKKSGDMRQITAPYSKTYMSMLRSVNLILQSLHEPSKHTMGFVPGHSIVDNAAMHKCMNYVFNIDLKDFFPSIERKRIVSRLQYKPFGLSEEVALTIAGLCCMRVENGESSDGQKLYKFVLPQGSPASPTLTNIVCDKLDFLLSGVAKHFGLNYTRYADDITFSSMHNVYQEDSEFRHELARIITEQGFCMNEKKTRLNKKGSRQEVTGLTVSAEKVNVTRRYVKELRNLLFIWSKYGYGVAQYKLHEYNAKVHPEKRIGVYLENVVSGKLMFLKMVKGEDDSTFKTLHAQYTKLMEKMARTQPKSNHEEKTVYLETMKLSEFEQLWQKKSILKHSKDGGRYVEFEPAGTAIGSGASVHRSTPADMPLDKLYISLCQNKKGQFYLVHEKFISPQIKAKVDVDKLSLALDELLCVANSNTIESETINLL